MTWVISILIVFASIVALIFIPYWIGRIFHSNEGYGTCWFTGFAVIGISLFIILVFKSLVIDIHKIIFAI